MEIVLLTVTVALGDGPADSDEEFAEDFQPSADNSAFNRDNTLQDEEFKTLPSFEHPLEVRVLEEIISSAVTQGLSSGVKITNQEVYKDTGNYNNPVILIFALVV